MLQELKCTDDAFPVEQLRKAGYHAVWRGERTWNGVAILAKGSEPVLTQTALPGDRNDVQARYIEAAVQGVLIGAFISQTAIRSQVRNSSTSLTGSNV